MKSLILLGIRFYWILIPKDKRKNCIFKESCSHYVYNITKKHGFLKGVKSFLLRKKQCRKGYIFILDENGNVIIQLADGSKINEEYVSKTLMDEISILKMHLNNIELTRSPANQSVQ
jgi:hypothetical protein